MPYRPFHPAIDETLKIPEKCWPFLCLNLPEYNFAVQFYWPTLLRYHDCMPYKETAVSLIRESLSINVRR